jgi:large subunit ribosomal protein L9
MKVVFLQDVPDVARAGDIKEVANGYGRNYLIPKKLALQATPEIIKTIGKRIEVTARNQAQTEAELLGLADHLHEREITLEARAGVKDRLYGSITAADIANELKKVTGFAVDKRKIELDEPIRQVGSYDVVIKFAKDIVPKIRVTVTEKVT